MRFLQPRLSHALLHYTEGPDKILPLLAVFGVIRRGPTVVMSLEVC